MHSESQVSQGYTVRPYLKMERGRHGVGKLEERDEWETEREEGRR